MKRPIVTASIALAVVFLGLMLVGSLMPGQTRIEQSYTMNGTPERVWPLFADLKGWPSWYWAEDGTHMTLSSLLNRAGVTEGTIRRVEMSNGGFYEEKVTAFEVNKRLALEGVRTPGRQNWKQEIVLEQVGTEQTKVNWVIEYEVQGAILKLLNSTRAQDELTALMDGSLKGIEPRVPTAADWGPAGEQKPAAAPAEGAPAEGAAPAAAPAEGAAPAAAPAGQ